MQCANNLKQIGLGLHNYHAAHKSFPMGGLSHPTSGFPFNVPEWPQVLYYIMPFVEQAQLYKGMAVLQQAELKPWYASLTEWPAECRDVAPSTYLCPSDGMGGPTKAFTSGVPGNDPNGVHLFVTNYLGIFSGLNDEDQRLAGLGDAAFDQSLRAVFNLNHSTRIRDIVDGTSNTLAMAEYLTGKPDDTRGYAWTNRAGCKLLYVAMTPNTSAPDNLLAHPQFCLDYRANYPELNLPCAPGDRITNTAAARSRHPGGVHGLLCDGSVNFFAETIDAAVWRSLGFLSDGGPLGGF